MDEQINFGELRNMQMYMWSQLTKITLDIFIEFHINLLI